VGEARRGEVRDLPSGVVGRGIYGGKRRGSIGRDGYSRGSIGRIGRRVGSGTIPCSKNGMYGTVGRVGVVGGGVNFVSLHGRNGLEGLFDFSSLIVFSSLVAVDSSSSFNASNLNLFFGARHIGDADLLLGLESFETASGEPGEGLRDSAL
jgi:hypothetical protein